MAEKTEVEMLKEKLFNKKENGWNGVKNKENIFDYAKGYIDFTDEGRRIAEKVYNRHQILTAFLISIGVSEKQAEEDACRIEHIISDETQQCIQDFLKKQS